MLCRCMSPSTRANDKQKLHFCCPRCHADWQHRPGHPVPHHPGLGHDLVGHCRTLPPGPSACVSAMHAAAHVPHIHAERLAVLLSAAVCYQGHKAGYAVDPVMMTQGCACQRPAQQAQVACVPTDQRLAFTSCMVLMGLPLCCRYCLTWIPGGVAFLKRMLGMS
jgi:hypothetical protein